MTNRTERRAAPAPSQSWPTVQLQSVNFSVAVAGPGGGAGIGWVVGPRADEIAYLPTLNLVAIRKGKSETAHPVTIATRMVATVPLLGDES